MKLSEWLETKTPTIFVDQDNTLLAIAHMESISRMGHWANSNSKFANIMGNSIGIIPRPYATKFLSECKKLGKVYILTAGISFFQKQVLDSVGMLSDIDGVFGRDNYHEVPQGTRGILIDNLPHDHPNSVAKLRAMGGGMFLKVPDWEGINPKDDALLKAIPKIQKAFAP